MAQAIREFALYAWAAIIVLVMVATVCYFAVLHPSKLEPSRCAVGAELLCHDYQIKNENDRGYVRLNLILDLQESIFVDAITCKFHSRSGTTTYEGEIWPPGETRLFTCEMPEFYGLENEKVEVRYEITYRNTPEGFSHLVMGDVFAEVQ